MTDTIHQFVTIDDHDNILWVSVTPEGERRDYDLLTDRDGYYVRAWRENGRDTYQVCCGGSRMGNTLTWYGSTTDERARHFARAVGARYYKTGSGFDRAIERALASVN